MSSSVDEVRRRIEPRWLERSNVQRRCVDQLSVEDFVSTFERPGVPVILTGEIAKWPAATEWTRARLTERFGDTQFRVSASVDMSLRDYLEYADTRGTSEDRPLYLFDKDWCSKCPSMASEFSIPPYFADDLMSVLGEARRPDYKWLIIGLAGTGSSFHVDPNCHSAWNANIVGRKKWVLYPPAHPPPLTAGDEHTLCLPRWFREHYDDDEHEAVRLECVTEAGECMFVPAGWWHCVLNLELCIAITHNVVTMQNLMPVLGFFESPAQCAPGEGCRGTTKFDFSGDVPASVIYPFASQVEQLPPAEEPHEEQRGMCACSKEQHRLLRDFRDGLQRHRPGILEAQLEQRAAKRARCASVWTKCGLVKGEAAPRADNVEAGPDAHRALESLGGSEGTVVFKFGFE